MGHNCNAEVIGIRILGLHKNLVWAPVLFVKVKKWIEFEPKTKSKYIALEKIIILNFSPDLLNVPGFTQP